MRRSSLAPVLGALGAVLLLSTAITVFLGNPRLVLAKLALGVAALGASFALGEAGGLRRFFGGRALRFGARAALSTLALLAALGAANWAAWRHPRSWDLTRDRIFTLQEDTLRTLRGLTSEVKAVAVYRADEEGQPAARALLERYAAVSPRFTYELVDPFRDPARAKARGVAAGGARIVLLAGEKRAPAYAPDEQGVTNALVKLTRDRSRRVYFTTGHGEPDPRGDGPQGCGAVAKALLAEGDEVSPLSLAEAAVPADAAVVISAGARTALLPTEVEALRRYAARGGHLGVFLEPGVDAGLDGLLQAYGVEADDDVVVDLSPAAQLFGSPVSPLAAPSSSHPISRELGDTGLVFPTARSLVALRDAGARPTPLALTGPDAWGETDLRAVFERGDAHRDEGEKGGPLPLAMAVERAATAQGGAPAGATRLVVVGDADFFTNQYLQLGANRDFALNAIGWLADEPDRITVRPRSREGSLVLLTTAQARLLEFLSVDLLPVTLLAAGLVIWTVRRAR